MTLTEARTRKAAEKGSRKLLEAIQRLQGIPTPAIIELPPAPRKAAIRVPAKPRDRRKPRPIDPDQTTIANVKAKVAAFCKVKVSELDGPCKTRGLANARQVAMHLAYKRTGASLPQIARHFGGRHHTTVFHAIRAVNERRARSVLYDITVKHVEALL